MVLSAPLSGNDGGDAFFLEPAEEAPKLSPQDALVRKGGEEDLKGIEDDPFCLDGVDGVAEADEEAFQVVLPGFFDLRAFYVDVIDGELLLLRTSPSRSKPREETFVVSSSLVSSKAMKTPGSL